MSKVYVLLAILILLALSIPTTSQEVIFIILDIQYSPDGSKLAVAGGDPQCDSDNLDKFAIRILDAQTFDTIATLIGHDCPVIDVNWDPTSQFLVSNGDTDVSIVWDVNTSSIIKKVASINNFLTYEGKIWNPTYPEIVDYVHNEPNIYIWNPFTGERLKQFEMPEIVTSIEWDITGDMLIVGSLNYLYIVDKNTGIIVSSLTINGGSTLSIQKNPVNPNEFAELIKINLIYTTITDSMPLTDVLEAKWRLDGRILAIKRTENRITFWDTVTQSIIEEYQSNYIINAFTWNPNTGWLLITSPDSLNGLEEVTFDLSAVPTLTPTFTPLPPTETPYYTPILLFCLFKPSSIYINSRFWILAFLYIP
jgi:WD40 repeat protein